MRFLITIVLSMGFAFAEPLEDMSCEAIFHAWLAKNRGDQKGYDVYVKTAIQTLKDGANPLGSCRYLFSEIRGQVFSNSSTPYELAIQLSVMPVIKFIFEEMKISPQQLYPGGWGAPIDSLPCDVKVVKYFLDKGLDPNYVAKDTKGQPRIDSFLEPLVLKYTAPIAFTKKEEDRIRKQCKDAIELVLKRGGDPNAPVSTTGSTVLHLLEKENDPYNMYELFVKHGAREDIKNIKGYTPRDLYYGKAK